MTEHFLYGRCVLSSFSLHEHSIIYTRLGSHVKEAACSVAGVCVVPNQNLIASRRDCNNSAGRARPSLRRH